MKTRHPIASLLLAGLLVAGVAAARTPTRAYTYHGELSEEGKPAQGVYDFRFTLHASPDMDAAVDWVETPGMQVRDGRIAAPLALRELPVDDLNYWIEAGVRVSGSGEPFATLSPRQPLIVAPGVKTVGTGTTASGQAYKVAFTPDTLIGNSTVLLGSINVPAGAYVAFVRMQVRTGDDDPPGNSFRLDCTLSPGLDSGVYRVGMEASAERYVTFQGATTLATAGAIQFSCRDGNGHTDTVRSGSLVILGVGAVN